MLQNEGFKLLFLEFFCLKGIGAPKIYLTLGALRNSTPSPPPAPPLGLIQLTPCPSEAVAPASAEKYCGLAA